MKYRLYVQTQDGREISGVYGWAEALARFMVCLRDMRVKSFAMVEAR